MFTIKDLTATMSITMLFGSVAVNNKSADKKQTGK